MNLHYLPLHKHPYYKGQRKYENLSNSEEYSQSAISIPIFNKFDKPKIGVIQLGEEVECRVQCEVERATSRDLELNQHSHS